MPGRLRSPFRGRLSHLQKAAKKRSYGCALFPLPEGISRSILDWVGRAVPPHFLSPEGREDAPHVTLKYGFHDLPGELARLRKMVQDHGPVTVTLGAISVFPDTGDGEVLKLEVSGEGLHELYHEISQAFDCEDRWYPDYNPHVTLAYLKPGKARRYVGVGNPFSGTELVLEELKYSTAKKEISLIPLTKAMSAFSEGSGGALIAPPAFGLGVNHEEEERRARKYLAKALEERRDSLQRRYCFDTGVGRRVICPTRVTTTPLRRVKPKEVADRFATNLDLAIKQGTVLNADQIQSLGEEMSRYSRKDVREIRKRLGQKKGSAHKHELVKAIVDHIVQAGIEEQVRQMGDRLPGVTPDEAPAPAQEPAQEAAPEPAQDRSGWDDGDLITVEPEAPEKPAEAAPVDDLFEPTRGEGDYRVEVPRPADTGFWADERLKDALAESLKGDPAAGKITPEAAEQYSRVIRGVYGRMPRVARDRVAAGIDRFRFSPDTAGIAEINVEETGRAFIQKAMLMPESELMTFAQGAPQFIAQYMGDDGLAGFTAALKGVGGDIGRFREVVAEYVGLAAMRMKRAEYRELKKKQMAPIGGYTGHTRTMILDGVPRYVEPDDPKNPMAGWTTHEFTDAHDPMTGTYAHEMAHAVDAGFVYSGSSAWREIFREEIEGTGRLGWYATTKTYEGFAEFGRLVYAGAHDLKHIEKAFPRCAAFFKQNGLWPEGGTDGGREVSE